MLVILDILEQEEDKKEATHPEESAEEWPLPLRKQVISITGEIVEIDE